MDSALDDISTFSASDKSDEDEDDELSELQSTNSMLRNILIALGALLGVALISIAALIVYAKKKSTRYTPVSQPIASNVPVWDARASHDGPYDPHEKPFQRTTYGDPFTDRDSDAAAHKQALLTSDPYSDVPRTQH
jgi:hypothetical protein